MSQLMESTVRDIQTDSFSEVIRKMIDDGRLASTASGTLKAQVITWVQEYSAELPLLSGRVPELFLELCDLMVTGRLSKMPSDTFKVFLVIMTYSRTSEQRTLRDLRLIGKMTGIADRTAIRQVLEDLCEEGYIDSVEDPIFRRRVRRKTASGMDRLFFP